MTKFARKCNIKALSATFVLLICLFVLFAFAGCDRHETVSSAVYGIYLKGYAYDEETLTVTAHVAVSGTAEQRLAEVTAAGERKAYDEGLFYKRISIRVALDEGAIYAAVRENMTREAWTKDDVVYENLKVVMRYDTKYKSIVTNGVRHPSGSGYVDILALDEEGEGEFIISQRTQNAANWYSLLLAGGIVLLAALMTAYAAYKNAKNKKEKEYMEALPQEVAYAEEDRRKESDEGDAR